MKYRGKGKIKKQHGMIDGLRKLLESIQDWPEIDGIIPGRINPCKLGGKVKLRISYQTLTGLKIIANSHGGVQEVFFVAQNPVVLEQKLRDFFDLK